MLHYLAFGSVFIAFSLLEFAKDAIPAPGESLQNANASESPMTVEETELDARGQLPKASSQTMAGSLQKCWK